MNVKQQIGYVPDRPVVFDRLTGREFIDFMGKLHHVRDAFSQVIPYAKLFEMDDLIDRPIKGYSHGNKQKIVVLSQISFSPKLLILDEPTVGLDPKSAKTLRVVSTVA